MKKIYAVLTALIVIISNVSYAEEVSHQHSKVIEKKLPASIELVVLSSPALIVGKNAKITIKLTQKQSGEPITFNDLKKVHTKKLHLLIVDPSLTDYHHIHPVEGSAAGEYVFDFTPNKEGSYRIWADVTPIATEKQEYVTADMGTPAKRKLGIDKKIFMVSEVNGFIFTLSLEGEAIAGDAVMGKITISKDGKPFTKLEPLMGAFAHVVGFSEDYHSVMHIHPMGREPKNDSERGGSVLELHIEPEAPGFVKLFAQIHVDGKDIFAPFGIMVK